MAKDNRYALIIGVGMDLPRTKNDARAIYSCLADPLIGRFHLENIDLLIEDGSGPNEQIADSKTAKNILLKYTRISRKDPDATFVIYYSGHGGLIKEKDVPEGYYMLMYGYNQWNAETLLNGNEFSFLINEINSNKLLVLLDCCYADGLEDESSVFTQVEQNEDKRKTLAMRNMGGGQGRVFISSCKDHEKSYIAPKANISLFTTELVNTLNGAYCKNADPYVNVVHLFVPLILYVPETAKKMHGESQTPVISSIDDLDGKFQLCQNPGWKDFKKTAPKTPNELAVVESSAPPVDFEEIIGQLNQYDGWVGLEDIAQDVQQLVRENLDPVILDQFQKELEVEGTMVNRIKKIVSKGWQSLIPRW